MKSRTAHNKSKECEIIFRKIRIFTLTRTKKTSSCKYLSFHTHITLSSYKIDYLKKSIIYFKERETKHFCLQNDYSFCGWQNSN